MKVIDNRCCLELALFMDNRAQWMKKWAWKLVQFKRHPKTSHEKQKPFSLFSILYHIISEIQVYELLNWWVICPFKLPNFASEEPCHFLFMSMSCMAELPRSALATGAQAIQSPSNQLEQELLSYIATKWLITKPACFQFSSDSNNPPLPTHTGARHKSTAILPCREILDSLTPTGLVLFSNLRYIY